MLNDFKQLTIDQNFIRTWLERINETDISIIKETIDLMRTNREYRTWILDYAKQSEMRTK
jgi:hypothetical protein